MTIEEARLKMSTIPDYGDLITIEEFIATVEVGGFIDYDGFGKYATETQMSNKEIILSDVKRDKIDKSFSHVVWFNR